MLWLLYFAVPEYFIDCQQGRGEDELLPTPAPCQRLVFAFHHLPNGRDEMSQAYID